MEHLMTPRRTDRTSSLPGRDAPAFAVPTHHAVLDTPLQGPWPTGTEVLYVAMGCFWGAERIFWRLDGVVTTAAGYMGGATSHPTYEEVCTGRTGHTEAVLVAYDPQRIDPVALLQAFWENHDPTTANRQGNDVGTQYRSAVYWTTPEQQRAALQTASAFREVIARDGHGPIVTELRAADGAGPFYYAETVHQQYLHKNPGGYCNHGPNGYTCPTGIARQDELPSQQSVLDPRQ